MAIISSTDITAATRRSNIRELAGISDVTFTDDDLDLKIENADEIARTYFGVQGVTLDGDEEYFRNLITVANLICSNLIRHGIGGQENISVAKEQMALYKSIVAAQNRHEPEQGVRTAQKTRGINNQTGDFG